MKKNKLELVDSDSYYLAFKQWLDSSNAIFDFKNENLMNDLWLKFADEIGISLGINNENKDFNIEVIDSTCWKEAKKYYSIISYKVALEDENV